MPRFTMKLNDGPVPEHPEHDWIVLKDGRFVAGFAGFAGSNAAERFIQSEESSERVDACMSRAKARRNQRR